MECPFFVCPQDRTFLVRIAEVAWELHDFVVMPNTFWSQVTDEDRETAAPLCARAQGQSPRGGDTRH